MPRRLVLVLAALCLSGCGMVSSERPLFGPSDTRGAPVLKPGLWVVIQPGCRFNTRSPADKWPDCAHAIDLRDGVATNAKIQDQGRFEGSSVVVVAAGDPAIVQAQAPRDGSGCGAFVYFALRPLASDGEGQILRGRVWPILCAKPLKPGAPTPAKPPKLPAGLVGGKSPLSNCLARAPGPVRTAARTSEVWAFAGTPDDQGREAHWIRDRDR